MTLFPFSIRTASSLSPVSLMKLTEIDNPDDLLKKFNKNNILAEGKIDGWKLQVIKESGKVKLFSRRGEEVTDNFPTITKALSNLPDGTFCEGEIAYEDKGIQDVSKVTSLAGSSAEKALEKAKELPGKVKLYLYDILWYKGKNITEKPFSERRKLLESVVKPSEIVLLTKQLPFSDWQKVMKDARAHGGEGVVFKLKDAKYYWKPKGQSEPKPADAMFKFKKGGGKSESDDYVVYDTKKSPTGKILALFGQYYKGKLYGISQIDNFSEKDETEVISRLKKGPFVIEIGFQERLPGGLRHQKFLRFRDDKKPKDATMNEFHAKHLDEFEPANVRKAMFALAATLPSDKELLTTIEQDIGSPKSVLTTPMRIGNIGNVDGDKMFRIMSKLESGGRTDTVGDSGTSFGPTQVHGPYLLAGLAQMPGAEAATGLSSSEMRQLSSEWLSALKKIRSVNLWKLIPVDQGEAKSLPKVVRMEQTFIRRPDMVIEKKGDQFVGKVIDVEAMRSLGFNVDSEAFRRTLTKIYTTYITDNVAKSVLAQEYLSQVAPLAFQKFKRQFNSTSIRKNKALSNLLERASIADFSKRIAAVSSAVEKSGYDTTISGAFNIYQLIIISNAAGVGSVQRFLLNKVPFGRGQLHYLQSSRFKQIVATLGKNEPDLSEITNQLLAGLPPNNGFAGFSEKRIGNIIPRLMAFALENRKMTPEQLAYQQAYNIKELITKWLNLEQVSQADLRSAGLVMIRPDWNTEPPRLLLWTHNDNKLLKSLLPKTIGEMEIVLHYEPAIEEFEDEPTPVDVESKMPSKLFNAHRLWLQRLRKEMEKEPIQMSEKELRNTAWFYAAKEVGYSQEELQRLKSLLGGYDWLTIEGDLPKQASQMGNTLAFPGQYADDIRSGKIDKTIRLADMPVEPDEVLMAITYSNMPICNIKILSKETMSLPRLEKAHGKHVARSLEHRFGPNRRFVVIRFMRFDNNSADDGELDEKKRGEVLIDKDGVKLTRGQIYDHYAKPAIRKQIMSRIKGKPVLIYLGVGKNEKILKRNHNNKPIVIDNDDEKDSENPRNYWYWIKRRMTSIHEVFGTKTHIGFVDLDLHGGYTLDKAKEYAKKLAPIIKEKFGIQPKIYQSGGTGLHIEFELGKETSIDGLRKELREMLDKLNEDFEGATTSTVKGKGMRTDVSTLHNKGSLRVPGAIGETWGKVKKSLSQDTDDVYENNNFGGKPTDTGPFGDGGAITAPPYQSSAPQQVGVWTASEKRKSLFRQAGDF